MIVFGGSFNPPTLAHYRLAQHVLNHSGEGPIVWIPVGNHYAKQGLIDCRHRVQMCREMLQGEEHMSVSEMECNDTLPMGSYHTLLAIQANHPKEEVSFLIGADHLPGLPNWIEAETLLSKFHIWVVPRPGYTLEPHLKDQTFFERHASHIHYITDAPEMDLSASEIRRQLASGKVLSTHIHPEVLKYILQNRLYGV